jgi:hypothetical protein
LRWLTKFDAASFAVSTILVIDGGYVADAPLTLTAIAKRRPAAVGLKIMV